MKREPAEKALDQYIQRRNLGDILPSRVHSLIELHHFEKGEYLCHAGDSINCFHILVEGRCNVLASSENGKEALINYISPVGINGDLELFIGCPAINNVVAVTAVTVIAIGKTVFFRDMAQIPAFMMMLCNSLANKIYTSTHWHSDNMLYPAKVRLSRYLLMSANKQNSKEVKIGMTETALILGCSVRHLRRLLCEYEDQGTIERARGKIFILRREALQSDAFEF